MKSEKTNFFKNVTVLVSGTALSQIISFALTPLITRIYGPVAYGIMGTFSAMISIFIPVVALTYPIAIVLPKKNDEVNAVIRLSFYTTLLFTAFSLLFLFSFDNFIIEKFNLHSISRYLYLFPIALFSGGILQILEQVFIRENLFKISAKASIIQTIIAQLSKVLLGLVTPSASILVFITAILQGIKAIVLFILSGFKLKKVKELLRIKKSEMLITAKKYKEFPLFRAPQTLIDAVTISLPVLFLSTIFSPEIAGFYSLSKTTLNVPIDLISKAVGDVFYPSVSKKAQDGSSITHLIKKSTVVLFLIGIVPFSVIILLGPSIFSIVFGKEWILSGSYARWIALWSFSSFILQPALRSLPVIKGQAFHLLFTIVSLLIRLALLIGASFYFKNDVISIAIFGSSSAFFNVLLILITIKKSKRIIWTKF